MYEYLYILCTIHQDLEMIKCFSFAEIRNPSHARVRGGRESKPFLTFSKYETRLNTVARKTRMMLTRPKTFMQGASMIGLNQEILRHQGPYISLTVHAGSLSPAHCACLSRSPRWRIHGRHAQGGQS